MSTARVTHRPRRALRGLAEAKVPGIEALLREADSEESPALVRQEAKVQTRRLRAER